MITNLREIINQACIDAGCPDLVDKIQIKWSNRFSSRIGDALYYKNGTAIKGRIRLSTKLFYTQSVENQLDVLKHEAAHVITHHKFPFANHKYLKGHGPEWRSVCRVVGCKPQRYATEEQADFATHRRKRRKQMKYHVNCCCPNGIYVSATIYKRMTTQHSTYTCRQCRGRLKPDF